MNVGSDGSSSATEMVRLSELASIRSRFSPNDEVLELGGGTGYQASVIASWGCHVRSLDLADSHHQPTHFNVERYDGVKIPAADASVDVVFSSCVLEHVTDFARLSSEIIRVLKPAGRAIHLVPTPYWRAWSSLGHYPYLLKTAAQNAMALRAPSSDSVDDRPQLGRALKRHSLGHVLRRVIAAGPHGAHGTELGELVRYSKWYWVRLFKRAGFRVNDVAPGGLFYTGCGLFPSMSMTMRTALAPVLGSAVYVFDVRPGVR